MFILLAITNPTETSFAEDKHNKNKGGGAKSSF